MTSLLVWVASDSRGPSSLNMATDSRLSWPGEVRWDEAKKVYASREQPFIFSFCGDSFFPTHALGKIVDQLDAGLIHTFDEVEKLLRKLWTGYPIIHDEKFTIYAGFRTGEFMNSRFSLIKMRLSYSDEIGQWKNEEVDVTFGSQILVVDGSGKKEVMEFSAAWNLTPSANTSRAHYSSLAEAVAKGDDPATGGSPQLGALYRKGGGRLVGVVHEAGESNARRFFGGVDLTGSEMTGNVEWRNDLFERVNSKNNRRLITAQPHDPRRVMTPRGL